MTNLNIPVGVSDFSQIRENEYYYVDKTGLISELLKKSTANVTLITRPRRFGKTLAMSMLEHFFDIRHDNHSLFQDLEISHESAICQTWMNQRPTLFITFKDVDGITFDSAFDMLKFVISQICIEYSYLEQSDAVSDAYKEIFKRLKNQTASATDVKGSILILMKSLRVIGRIQAIMQLFALSLIMLEAVSQ